MTRTEGMPQHVRLRITAAPEGRLPAGHPRVQLHSSVSLATSSSLPFQPPPLSSNVRRPTGQCGMRHPKDTKRVYV